MYITLGARLVHGIEAMRNKIQTFPVFRMQNEMKYFLEGRKNMGKIGSSPTPRKSLSLATYFYVFIALI
jgi:hypothetical protein